jgi:hypothetical protein
MFLAATLAFALARAAIAQDAVTDRGPRPKPALVKVGVAGFSFNDPVFGSRLWRVTDRFTRPDQVDRSYRTPSAAHQNAWSADSSYFYVLSTDGTVVPFAFDPERGAASRLEALRFYIEPQFSYRNAGILFGSVSGGSLRTIDQYDFATGEYTQLLDLDLLATGLKDTYIGGVSSSAGATERILAFFGGTSQDRHHYVVVFDRHAPHNRKLLDTATLDFKLHHATIDRSGRYVMLYPPGGDLEAPRKAAPVYVWDTATGVTTPLPLTTAISGGHDVFGYGIRINQDCCATTTWDAAQWQIRSLASPLVSRDLITPVITPKQVYLADHASWHNARPDRLMPFVTATYRYGANTTEWRAWDDEILVVQTDVGDGGAEVVRLAHHRTDIRHDDAPERSIFWYMPRPNISRDGRWLLFTSNWEKSLGVDLKAPAGERARQDVFLLQMPRFDPDDAAPEPELPLEIATTVLPDGRVKRAYSAALQASRSATWRVSGGALPPGLSLSATGQIAGTPKSAGAWYSEITATDAAGSASRVFLLTVRK